MSKMFMGIVIMIKWARLFCITLWARAVCRTFRRVQGHWLQPPLSPLSPPCPPQPPTHLLPKYPRLSSFSLCLSSFPCTYHPSLSSFSCLRHDVWYKQNPKRGRLPDGVSDQNHFWEIEEEIFQWLGWHHKQTWLSLISIFGFLFWSSIFPNLEKTASQYNPWFEFQSWMKVKVVKWCRKR